MSSRRKRSSSRYSDDEEFDPNQFDPIHDIGSTSESDEPPLKKRKESNKNNKEIKPKKNTKRKSNKPKTKNEIIETISECTDKFLDQRYEETNIHPTHDSAVIFICRLLKNFIIRTPHKLWYYRFCDETLRLEPHFLSTSCIGKLRSIFNAIPSEFKYTSSAKEGDERKRSRVWTPRTKFGVDGLEMTRIFRKLLKYKAMNYGKMKIEQREYEWEWIDEGTENENVTEYERISNGRTQYKIGDIVSVHVGGKSILEMIRPWIARIISLYENDEDGMKKVKLRWFWFWNQIVDENDDENMVLLREDAKDSFVDGRYPATNWDMFENVINDKTYETVTNVSDIDEKVYIIDESSSKYKHLVNGHSVFYCDHYYDNIKKMFIKMNRQELKENEQRLMQSNINKDNKMEEEDNDSDLDLDDIRKDGDRFSVVKPNKNKNNKIIKMLDDDLSDDESLTSNEI